MTINAAEYHLVPELTECFAKTLAWFDDQKINFRIWAKDASLFTGHNEMLMMDWLNAPREMLQDLSSLKSMKEAIDRRDFTHYVLAGMGGSSLAAKVMQNILALASQSQFYILDTIHPDEIARLMSQLDLAKTLFIISSKSGTTFEPLFLYRYFEQSLRKEHISDVFSHFQTITDPISELEQESVENGFLLGPFGKPGIGGRFSALSPFGIWPALLMDIDAPKLLRHAIDEMQDLAPHVPTKENMAALLAAFLAAHLEQNIDKLVIHVSPRFFSLARWLEQLIAESLGKDGKGLVPIIAHEDIEETAGCCHLYIVDIQMSSPQMRGSANPWMPTYAGMTTGAGNFGRKSYFSIFVEDPYHLGAVMYCLEMAVVFLAGVLKVNPFDQPDVEKSKIKTKEVIDQFKSQGKIAVDLKHYSLNLSLTGDVQEFLKNIGPNDYCVLLSFLDETASNIEKLNDVRAAIAKRINVPVLLQTGPRYLHSTGQLWKGGKNNGHFIIITGPYAEDLFNQHFAINFSDAHIAQAIGDYLALLSSQRRVLYAHCNNIDLACKELIGIIS